MEINNCFFMKWIFLDSQLANLGRSIILYALNIICLHSFGLLYKSIFMLYGEDGTNKKLASLNIVAKCLDYVSKLHRSTNILYFHRFSDPHPLYLFDFLMSKSPTSYNASWWRRNDLLFYLILACMWCIKLIMQEK